MAPPCVRPLLLGAALWLCGTTCLAAPPDPVSNPLRGRDDVLVAGHAAFENHCAVCHGHEATQATPEGPDLRRLDSFCRRLLDDTLRARCLRDVDTHFLHSVLEGKVRGGIRYMPAWQNTLTEETIWSIRTYLESRANAGAGSPRP